MWANSSGTEVAYGRAMLEVLTLQGFATRELKSDMWIKVGISIQIEVLMFLLSHNMHD